MPAINVARTDTFEQQRVKINQIGDQIFNVTAGGSDLSTGNLKLGDGTKSNPSLAFVSDNSLGLYKPESGTIRYIHNLKKIFDIKQSEVSFYRNVVLQQSLINTNGLSITNSGSNYDPGSYSAIPLTGGTGDGALINIEVTPFNGVITNAGKGYLVGNYTSILLEGGNGSGAAATFSVIGIEGQIQNAGSLYLPGSYTNVPLINGSGSGATADITITGDISYSGSITSPGSNYTDVTDQQYNIFNVPSTTYTVGITPNGGTPPPDNLYTINGVTQQALTLVRGRTYRFDLSSADLSSHPFAFQNTDETQLDLDFYVIQSSGTIGSAGAFVDLIINDQAPVGTIQYYCESHEGMGASISITTGTSGNFGINGLAQVTTSGGAVTSFTILSGENYEAGDALQLSPNDAGGSGFVYTISNISYSGVVTAVTITSSGSGYDQSDVLSISDSDVGGVGGSGFQFLVESDPQTITNFVFDNKGSGYSVSDVLSLPGRVTGLSANLGGITSGITASLTSGSVIVTVSSTSNIIPDMQVEAGDGDAGQFDPGTTVVSVDSPTQITVSQAAAATGSATLTFTSSNTTSVVLADVSGIAQNSIVTVASGSGSLPAGTTISSVDLATNTIILSQEPTTAGSVILSVDPPYGVPVTEFEYTINELGVIESIAVENQGNGYEIGDVLGVSARSLIQAEQLEITNRTLSRISFTTQISGSVFTLGNTIQLSADPGTEYEIHYKKIIGGFIDYILVDAAQTASGETIFETGSATLYTIDSISDTYRWFIDGDISPNLTLYVGNTYAFNTSDASNNGHNFALSKFADGIYQTVNNVSTTLTSGSPIITVSSTANILEGMSVDVSSGDGQLVAGTIVQSIDSATQITLSSPAFQSGSAVLSFAGTEFTDGVTKTGSSLLTLVVSESTPSTLYYYCSSGDGHENEGGYDGQESIITVDPNNPKTFGSGAEFLVAVVDINDVVTLDANQASLSVSSSVTTQTLNTTNIQNSGQITSQNIVANGSITSSSLVSSGLTVTSPSTNFSGNVTIGDTISAFASSGNIVSSGEIKTLGSFNSNDILSITNGIISSTAGNDISLNPSTGRVVKVNASTAITIPVGSTSDRPPTGIAESGSIRFNTETGQYEGYNQSTTSWSSLGGVRDLDGNTYITAEETIGSNDNTLWFYNDNINTVKFTPTHLEFRDVKRIRSSNINAPAFVEWTANTPVTLGQYLKFRNNLYEVTIAGVTGTSGSEPVHTSGALANGTSELTWSQLAVAPLIFEDIEVLRIGPLGGLPLSINSDLRLQNNIISTDINDLIIKPNFGKKVVIDAATTLALPVGPDSDRGIAIQGSVRFSTTTGQFEGYDGANWGSLGGVKDVDQNTYIIPELSPGSNENTLYFVNDNTNTLQVTKTSLDFYGIDTIRSVISDELEITASLLTFDNGTSTFDNTKADTTFLHTTKQYFDIGLSAGLSVDPVLRLDNQGDVYLNVGFGTGVINPVKIFDGELKEFELADIKITTDILTLIKGTSDSGSSSLYEVVNFAGSKTTVIAQNLTSGEKEFIEFGILDDGTDVYHTEYGNIRTGNQLIIPTFELTGSNVVVVNFTLGANINPTESIKITVVSNLTKK